MPTDLPRPIRLPRGNLGQLTIARHFHGTLDRSLSVDGYRNPSSSVSGPFWRRQHGQRNVVDQKEKQEDVEEDKENGRKKCRDEQGEDEFFFLKLRFLDAKLQSHLPSIRALLETLLSQIRK